MKYLRKFNEDFSGIDKLYDDVFDCFAELIDDKEVEINKQLGDDEAPTLIEIIFKKSNIFYNYVGRDLIAEIKHEKEFLKAKTKYVKVLEKLKKALTLFNDVKNVDNKIEVDYYTSENFISISFIL